MATGLSEAHPRRKFRIAYVLLALVVVGAVAAFFAFRSDPSTTTATGSTAEETWGNFQPAGLTSDRIQQIALHVGATYRMPAAVSWSR